MAAPKTVVVETLANAAKPATAAENASNAKEMAEHTPADTKTKADAKPNSNPNTINFISASEITIGDQLNNGLLTRKHKGRWNNMPVTIQKLCLDSNNSSQTLTSKLIYEIELEVKAMQGLQSPYIFQTLGYSAANYCIVMEDMAVSSLLDVVHYKKGIVWSLELRYQMITDMTRGLAYLHERDKVHGDFRSETLLVDGNNHVKIADFGLEKINMRLNGKFISQSMNHTRRPECWWAPELEARWDLIRTKESDVFSLGVTIWEVITGQFPPNVLDKALPTIPSNCPPDMSRLLTFCWKQPNERPKVSEIMAYLNDPKRATYTDKNALIPAKTAAAETVSVNPTASTATTAAMSAKK